MARVSHEIKDVRQIWEQIANEKLAEHDHKLIGSRSYAAQGIDIEPLTSKIFFEETKFTSRRFF